MKIIIQLLGAALFGILAFCFGIGFFEMLRYIEFNSSSPVFYFLISYAVSFLLFLIFVSGGSFFSIMKHEITHMVWGLLTFNKPHALHVEREEGGYMASRGYGSFFATLAPYFFPTVSYFFLIVFLFGISELLVFYIFLGIFMGFDTSTIVKDFSFQQPDLQRYTKVFSICVILWGLIFFYGGVMAFVIDGWDYAINFWKFGFKAIIRLL